MQLVSPCWQLILPTIPYRRKCPAKFIAYLSNGSSAILHSLCAESLVEDVLQRRSSQLIILSQYFINAPVVRFWYFFWRSTPWTVTHSACCTPSSDGF